MGEDCSDDDASCHSLGPAGLQRVRNSSHGAARLAPAAGIRQHTSACVSMRAYASHGAASLASCVSVSIHQHTCIRQHTSGYLAAVMSQSDVCECVCVCVFVCVPSGSHVAVGRAHSAAERLATHLTIRAHTSAYVSVYSIRQHTSAYIACVSIRLLTYAPRTCSHLPQSGIYI